MPKGPKGALKCPKRVLKVPKGAPKVLKRALKVPKGALKRAYSGQPPYLSCPGGKWQIKKFYNLDPWFMSCPWSKAFFKLNCLKCLFWLFQSPIFRLFFILVEFWKNHLNVGFRRLDFYANSCCSVPLKRNRTSRPCRHKNFQFWQEI